MITDNYHYFSIDYLTARRRFIQTAKDRGASLHSLAFGRRAPDGTPLSIDIAWFGAPSPKRAVIHSSGLHGVEGFAGSAIQLALMDYGIHPSPDSAVVFVHVLNPYGMAWLRRVNENNVDLNRNFLVFEGKVPPPSKTYTGMEKL